MTSRSPKTTHSMHSWLDIYPTAGGASPPKPEQNTRIASRVVKLRATLANLKEKIEIRQQIVNLAETNGRYCITCGPRPTKPYCSMTCPLLKPGRGWQPIRIGDRPWLQGAKKDVQRFWVLSSDVEDHGPQANLQTVRAWEATAAYLISRTADVNVPQRLIPSRVPPGFKANWTFTDNWGKGPCLEDELAPDEVEPTETA